MLLLGVEKVLLVGEGGQRGSTSSVADVAVAEEGCASAIAAGAGAE